MCTDDIDIGWLSGYVCGQDAKRKSWSGESVQNFAERPNAAALDAYDDIRLTTEDSSCYIQTAGCASKFYSNFLKGMLTRKFYLCAGYMGHYYVYIV